METTLTRHNADCARVFNRRDPKCPRCQELAQGAAPRKGWGQRSRFNPAPRPHVCSANCGIVCTAGEW